MIYLVYWCLLMVWLVIDGGNLYSPRSRDVVTETTPPWRHRAPDGAMGWFDVGFSTWSYSTVVLLPQNIQNSIQNFPTARRLTCIQICVVTWTHVLFCRSSELPSPTYPALHALQALKLLTRSAMRFWDDPHQLLYIPHFPENGNHQGIHRCILFTQSLLLYRYCSHVCMYIYIYMLIIATIITTVLLMMAITLTLRLYECSSFITRWWLLLFSSILIILVLISIVSIIIKVII